MKLKKQFRIIIILFIIIANIFAINRTPEVLSKLELNTIAICDAQAFVDFNVTLQIDVENYEEFVAFQIDLILHDIFFKIHLVFLADYFMIHIAYLIVNSN